jgi:hypothetical protein
VVVPQVARYVALALLRLLVFGEELQDSVWQSNGATTGTGLDAYSVFTTALSRPDGRRGSGGE